MATSSVFASFYFVLGAAIIFLAVLILRFSPRSISTWATALVMIFAGIGPILGAIGVIIEQNLPEGTYLFRDFVESFDYTWEFFFPSLLLAGIVYPQRYAAWKYIRRFAFILFLPHIFHLLMVLFLVDRVNPSRLFDFLGGLPLPSSVLASSVGGLSRSLNVFSELLFKAHGQLFSLVNVMYAVLAMSLFGLALRRDLTPRQRRQTHIVLAGIGIAVITYSLARVVPYFMGSQLDKNVAAALINASLIIGGGSVGYVIMKYQLIDVRLIARKGLFYASTAAIFAAVYLVVIKQFTRVITDYAGVELEFIETLLIILFILAFQPVLERLEEWAERALLREESPRVKLMNLSDELLSAVDVGSMKERIAGVLGNVLSTAEVETMLRDEVLALRSEDIYAERVVSMLEQHGEPVGKLDFIETLGFMRPRRGWLRPGRKLVREAVGTLPGIVRRMAAYELIVPVVHDGRCAAVLLLGERREGGRYSQQQQALLSMLAGQVAAALSRMELLEQIVEKKVMEEELNIARSIQINLLPSAPPQIDNYEASALSVSSKQVGGDYYDFLKSNGHFGFTVADVSGKGVPASLLMASLQASLRAMADRMTDPVAVIGRLNDVMCDITSPDKFATMFYGCLDLKRNEVVYSNAGHFFPVVVRATGGFEVLDYSGLILGVSPGFPYESHRLKLGRGDMIVVTTDGVTEAESAAGDLFGEERLHAFLSGLAGRDAAQVRDAIVEEVERFAYPRGANDDLTILVVRRLM
ncbi:MAG: PP2C family protein-serine/threonine phosphatase [Candidatus Krumholzibacteria bacterium]|nr:PP2C family protein-serine/threonine phosphatase [Candidatus Krumholzibacteria bacterium]